MRFTFGMTLLVGALAATAANGQLIYDDFGTHEFVPTVECGAFTQQSCVDDMIVGDGGTLTSLRYRIFNKGGSFSGGSETQSWDIMLLQDDGDGVPEVGGDDTLLYTNSYVNETVLFGTQRELAENLFSSAINVAPGDRLWAAISGLGFNMHVSVNDAPQNVGSSDQYLYRFGENTDVQDLSLNGQSGWELQLSAIIPEPSTLAIMAVGAVALLRRRRR